MEEEVVNFSNRNNNGFGAGENLEDLYERIPEPVTVEASRQDEFFYNNYKTSKKAKHRSLSLPHVRGNFILINRMTNCSPLNKARFWKFLTKVTQTLRHAYSQDPILLIDFQHKFTLR